MTGGTKGGISMGSYSSSGLKSTSPVSCSPSGDSSGLRACCCMASSENGSVMPRRPACITSSIIA